jgi:hypothetical protein
MGRWISPFSNATITVLPTGYDPTVPGGEHISAYIELFEATAGRLICTRPRPEGSLADDTMPRITPNTGMVTPPEENYT